MWTASLQKKMMFYLVKNHHKYLKNINLIIQLTYTSIKRAKNTLDKYQGYLYLKLMQYQLVI